jgi:hypothetical protein
MISTPVVRLLGMDLWHDVTGPRTQGSGLAKPMNADLRSDEASRNFLSASGAPDKKAGTERARLGAGNRRARLGPGGAIDRQAGVEIVKPTG